MRGFTLIEVLLATVLLAAGLALAFASLRAATGTTQRGEMLAQRGERVRAVEGFLRRRITGARPIAFGADPDSGQQYRFLGEDRRMRFVADVPDYLGRGGPYLHELVVENAGEGMRLTVSLTMVHAGVLLPERPPRPPEVLAEGLRDVRFRYRALTPENTLGDWQDNWEDAERLPLQVQVLLRDVDGRDWPAMVVALPLANSYAAMVGGMP
jgi:general secretion pathway protein J